MVNESTKSDEQLLPLKHGQSDLFLCDVADAVFKDLMPMMEHPFYSLSKKPETTVRRYEHNGHWLEITPSVKGLATIYDKDVLIYCISQLMDKIKQGQTVGPRLRINSRDLLVFTNRGTTGPEYEALREAIDRLAGTRISTNIRTGDEEQYDAFGLIDAASIRKKNGLDGRLLWVEIKLSDWVFNAIRSEEILTLSPDYFRLRKPLERRIYEIARKHCGRQEKWMISLEVLYKKSGSKSPVKHFRYMVRNIVEHDHLPDYRVVYDEASDNVTFFNRERWWDDAPLPSSDEILPLLSAETYDAARAAAPGYDVHALEHDWRDWWASSGKPKLQDAPAAFIGFCRARHKRAPISRSQSTEWKD